MRNDTGIFNSRNVINEYKNDLRRAFLALDPRTSVTPGDLCNLAQLVYVKLQIAIFHSNDIQIREREAQLKLIAETADLIA